MILLNLFADPLFRSVLMVLWLLPCAIQDYRTRRVSNWLTIPLFLIAWPMAILTGHFPLTFAVFVGVYVATKLEPRMGAADGKIMVGLTAFAPLALAFGVLLEMIVFAVLRVSRHRRTSTPGALWLSVGCVLSSIAMLSLRFYGFAGGR